MNDAAASTPAADAGAAGRGPGARLKAERELRGLALGVVAETLHVAPRVVAAMEANDFAAFDAPVYAKGFLRKYAGVLGIPVEEILAAYDALAGGPTHPTLIPAMNVSPSKPALPSLPLGPLLAAAALIVVGAGYWWWSGRARVTLPAAPVAADARPADHDGPAAAGTLVAVPVATPSTAPPADEVPAAAAPTTVAASAEPRARTAEAPPPAVTRRAAGATGAAREDTLVVHGLRECWVEVYSPSGARLVYDLVRPGEARAAAGPGPWKVFLGFADGARLTVGDHTVTVPSARRAAATARFVVARDGAAQ